MAKHQLFGWAFNRDAIKNEEEQKNQLEFATPITDDGALTISEGGAYGQYIDLENTAKSEAELVTTYRKMLNHTEVSLAIDAICNEAIVNDENNDIVKLVLDDLEEELSKVVREKIYEEFDNILSLLNFQNYAHDIFKTFYTDGRLKYHAIIDPQNPIEGIKELRFIDPRKLRKVKEVDKKKPNSQNQRLILQQVKNEYFIYSEKGFNTTSSNIMSGDMESVEGIKIPTDSIIQVTSGLLNENNSLVLGYLHTAIKPLNQLKMLEDAVVIYRVSRAPERRVFYIHVGNLPKQKAEQYVRDMMIRHKNKLVYDSATGDIRNDVKIMSMQEDYWLPRRDDGKSTEITTLPGGQTLGELDDVVYFQKKLYKSLKVPITRLEPETGMSLGRASEITRDEVNFAKFIARLRARFSILFDECLKRQLLLKNIISDKKWNEIANKIKYDFAMDNHFSELKNTEIIQNRIGVLRDTDEYVGKYYSKAWVRKNILYLNEEEIDEIKQDIEKEKKEEPDDEDGFGDGGGDNGNTFSNQKQPSNQGNNNDDDEEDNQNEGILLSDYDFELRKSKKTINI